MLTDVSSSVFTSSDSILMKPFVSAEWNQNLFNAPYITIAGNGSQMPITLSSGTVTDVTVGAKPNFTTKQFSMSNKKGSVTYNVTADDGRAYKIITYVKTDAPLPIMVTAYASGGATAYGSSQEEVSSLGWTKIITYIGVAKNQITGLTSFTYTINANTISGIDINPVVYFTLPQVYQTSYNDYNYSKLWPTDSVFTYFRPGESYVNSGNANCSLPTNYRKITSPTINGYTAAAYSPISSIVQMPSFFFAAPPVPTLKASLPTDISPYKYFVSDTSSKVITGIYEKSILTNKIVIKFNTLVSIPTITVSINNSLITVDGSSTITMPANSESFYTGLLTLYWTGSAWTKNRWSAMPSFNADGTISKTTTISKITVTQTSSTKRSEFNSYTSTQAVNDFTRMQLVEVSPRLEVDLSDFVQSLSIQKSLDAQNTLLPISSINANTCDISLSGIPLFYNNQIINIFSSQSDESTTLLSSILRKNIKFYVYFNLQQYSDLSTNTMQTSNEHIPGGVFYSDSWDESDIDSVSVQCFDVSRYLQATPVPDYVANLKTVFDIITNILDSAGFTDYNYDSLYRVCNNKAVPMDVSYFYCNSKDSTIVDTLNQIFTAYQIGAFIDEYGVMQFIDLYSILANNTSNVSIADFNIVQNGFGISNKAKPGKVSLRYQTPKVKQSPSLQNVTSPGIKNSPSFIYTTANDVVWSQQTIDSVGFNYLEGDMLKDSNVMNLNVNDLLNIFHTFNRDANGYAFIDNEIVSFLYKEYGISKTTGDPILVSIKNDLELQSEINRFIKEYSVGLLTTDGDDKHDYDVIVSPTGNITNVQRGLFGTVPSDHKRITNMASKGLSEKILNQNLTISASPGLTSIVDDHQLYPSLPSVSKVQVGVSGQAHTLIYPTSEVSRSYQTYSVKFDMPDQDVSSAGLFFNMSSDTNPANAYYIELRRFNQVDQKTSALYDPPNYRYILTAANRTSDELFWVDVTGECNSIVNNAAKIIVKNESAVNGVYEYSYVSDIPFNLKVVHYLSDGTDGEQENKRIISVFLNNIEITGWNEEKTDDYDETNNPTGSAWKPTSLNTLTGMRQKPYFTDSIQSNTKFGFITTLYPYDIPGIYPAIQYVVTNPRIDPACLREIHATQKPLKERSVSYFYQDREFLNGLVQGQPLYTNSITYLMQTTPEVSGINYYDVQYTTPAAVTVDVLPIEYMWDYFPGTDPQDQRNYQKKLIDEYSLSYSTPLNTGFRAKMAIANNSPHMVFLNKEADAVDKFTINLNLWTHEIVAPSDPEILEAVIDPSNISEVAQLDSEWIQSKQAAQRMLKVISMGIEGFSKVVTLDIFGNPLIQVGDIVTLTYQLKGISNQKYFVSAVDNNFSSGLETKLTMNRIQ